MLQFLLFLTLFIFVRSFSETQMLSKIQSGGTWERRQPQLLYIFITNRPENVTHGNVTFTGPPAGVEDIYFRSVFFPIVDKITRLDVNYTISNFIGNSSYDNLAVYVQYGLFPSNNYTQRTTRKLYQNASYAIGSYSAIVRMENGNVLNVTWDEGCFECSGPQCVDNFCGIEQDQCLTEGICDLKVFTAWIGTAADGTWCTSASYLPSVFRSMSDESVYIQAAGGDTKNFIFF